MLTIRRFQKGDEEILSIMIRRTLREVNYTSPKSELDYLIPHYSPETMVELSETGHTYVLEEDGQIIGSGTILPDGETEAEIVAAFLSPESIGKGYGRKLFETLETDELAAKATRVWLTSSDTPEAEPSFSFAAGGSSGPSAAAYASPALPPRTGKTPPQRHDATNKT